MKNVKKYVVLITLFLASIVFVVLVALFGEKQSYEREMYLTFEPEFVVENGSITTEDFNMEGKQADVFPFQVEEDGTYVFRAGWENEISGLITGLMVRDASGKVHYAMTADWCQAESVPLSLKAGEYTAEFHYLDNTEDKESFEKESGLNATDYEISVADGTGVARYEFELLKEASGAYKLGLIIGILAGVWAGLAIVFVAFTFIKKDKKKDFVYDERQELIRGRGFFYGMFTMMVSIGMLICLDMAGVTLPVDNVMLYIFIILAAAFVVICHAVVNDAYFSLNEHVVGVCVFIGLAGLYNLLIGIGSVIEYGLLQGGRLTFRSMNLFAGIFLFVVLAVIIFRNAIRKRDEEDEE